MGTNYYTHEEACKCCGLSHPPVHIGKSSGGWCFSLHVDPNIDLITLEDWVEWWTVIPGTTIQDEYGAAVSIEEMKDIITNRTWKGEFPKRHDIDGIHCIGHGPGTYDYITGEFS